MTGAQLCALPILDAAHGGSVVDAQLAVPTEQWREQLRHDCRSVGSADFLILAADLHDVDESLDFLILARRTA